LPFKLLFFNLQTIIEVLVAFTENALLLLLRNILWSTLLIFPFLFKTLGTQFAPPQYFYLQSQLVTSKILIHLTNKNINYNSLQLCFYKKEYFVGFE